MTINSENIGKFFRHKDGCVYQLITFCEHPTATLRKVGSKTAIIGGAIGSMNLSGFTLIEDSSLIEAVIDQYEGVITAGKCTHHPV